MQIESITNDSDYRAALRKIESLMGAKMATPEGRRLDVLVEQVRAWENKRHPLDRQAR